MYLENKKEMSDALKILEYYTVNGETAFLGKVSDTCYKAGIECRITSGYSTYEEAYKAFEHYKSVIEKG